MAREQYKDGFFRDLLGLDAGSRERFIDVANAAFGLGLQNDAKIEDASLDNVFYTKLRNDVAKIVNGTLIVLVEHQSTINENMPLRMMEYAAQTYLNLLNAEDRYKTRLQKIPRPLFAVFYNGKTDFPHKKVLRLSDAFMCTGKAMLELEVPVLNIKLNSNNDILKRSRVLHDYAVLCNNIEVCKQSGESDYVRAGILRTIKSGVLVEYLNRNIKEASGMLMAEYDYDTDMAVKAAENYELGMVSKALSTARAMLAERLPMAVIARCTGLSPDEVAALQQEAAS